MAGRETRIDLPGGVGGADEALERLASAAGKAADSTEELGREGKKKAEADKGERSQGGFGSGLLAGGLIQGVASGAIQSLGAPGAGAQDALFGGVRALQAALPALGATIGGANNGPLGSALGTVAGTTAAAGLERLVGPEARAREIAVGQTQQAFSSAAAQGVQLSAEELKDVYKQAHLLAERELNLERDVRRATGAF